MLSRGSCSPYLIKVTRISTHFPSGGQVRPRPRHGEALHEVTARARSLISFVQAARGRAFWLAAATSLICVYALLTSSVLL